MANEKDPAGEKPSEFTHIPSFPAGPAKRETPASESPEAPSIRLPGGSGEGGTDASQSVPASETTEDRPGWFDHFDRFLLVLLLVLSFLVASFRSANSDLWMQLATGRSLLAGDYAFGPDPYSCATGATADQPAVPWINHSWLFAALAYLVYQTAGGAGLVLVKAALFTGLILLLYRLARPQGNRWLLVVTLTMASLAVSNRLLVQSTVVSFLLLGVAMLLLHRGGALRPAAETADANPKWLWGLPVLMAVWVNFDAWFVMGLLAVALAAAGVGAMKLLKIPTAVSGGKLSAVLLASFLACFVSPFHVQVFQLPPELANLLLRFTDMAGLPAPDSMFAGGRALQILQRGESQPLPITLSPLSSRYFQDVNAGLTAAGVAFWPLLLLGLVSFGLLALVGHRPGAPVLHAGRFLVWIVFALLALGQHRIIPFFAIVAAPITALNLSEFIVWQARENPVLRWGTSKLARFVSVLVMLLLLYMAWPGWLHGPVEFNATHRVAWSIIEDPSLKRAAERLKERRSEGKCGAVFNLSNDIANYCAWFAPEVKCFVDYRYALFARDMESYAKARSALWNKGKTPTDWSKLFEQKGIDHVVLPNFEANPAQASWWGESQRWAQVYGDNRTMVFAWAGPNGRWPTDLLVRDWNRQAFGEVPLEQRPPAGGTPPPADLSFWKLYYDGIGPQPVETQDVYLKQLYFQFAAQPALVQAPVEWVHYCVGYVASAALAPALPGVPLHAQLMHEDRQLQHLFGSAPGKERPRRLHGEQVAGNNRPFFKGSDAGPPSAPLLMVRLARRGVAENPYEFRTHRALADACNVLWKSQEEWWANYSGQIPFTSPLRDNLRRVQVVAALRQAVQFSPNDYDLHMALAAKYRELNYLDLALEHFVFAEKALEQLRFPDKKQQELVDNKILDHRKNRARFETDIERRQKDLALKLPALPGVQKYREAAFNVYREVDAENKERVDEKGRGLVLAALKLIVDLKSKDLTPEEGLEVLNREVYLLLTMGQIGELAGEMPKLKDKLGPAYHNYQFLLAGATGDYDTMNLALDEIEKLAVQASAGREPFLAAHIVGFTVGASQGLFMPPLLQAALAVQNEPQVREMSVRFNISRFERLNLLALRGVVNLEAGDTVRARAAFQQAVDSAGPEFYFPDRPIAERYLELLRPQ